MPSSAAAHVRLSDKSRREARAALNGLIETARSLANDTGNEKRPFLKQGVGILHKRFRDETLPPTSDPAEIKQRERLRTFLDFARKKGFDGSGWGSIETRLSEKRTRTCSPGTIELVRWLLDISADADPTVLETADSRPDDTRPTERTGLLVDCHATVDEHRQVILGQLPSAGLYPAVFVFSRDRQRWYPQRDVVRIKKPGGVAFACHARFGNPHGIGHVPSDEIPEPFPWKGEVRVYALKSEPDKKQTPAVMKERELNAWVARYGQVGRFASVAITRDEPPIVSVSVESRQLRKEWKFRPVELLACSFPVDLSWNSRHTVSFEIRKTPTDEIVTDGSVLKDGKIRILPVGSSEVVANGTQKVLVPGHGIYRIRYWGVRKPFLDPELELWLDIKSELVDQRGHEVTRKRTRSMAPGGRPVRPTSGAHR